MAMMFLLHVIMSSSTLVFGCIFGQDVFFASTPDVIVTPQKAANELPNLEYYREQASVPEEVQNKRNAASSNVKYVNDESVLKQIVNELKNGSGNVAEVIENITLSQLPLHVCWEGLGVISYDSITQICCNGVHNKTKKDEICCDGELVDSSVYFCCNNEVQKKNEQIACCGIIRYDIRHGICCNGSLHMLDERSTENSECCGHNLCNTTVVGCCNDTRYAGDERLQEQTECCGEMPYGKTDIFCDTGCCNDRKFQRNCFECLDDKKLLAIFNDSLKDCCNRSMFESGTSSCGDLETMTGVKDMNDFEYEKTTATRKTPQWSANSKPVVNYHPHTIYGVIAGGSFILVTCVGVGLYIGRHHKKGKLFWKKQRTILIGVGRDAVDKHQNTVLPAIGFEGEYNDLIDEDYMYESDKQTSGLASSEKDILTWCVKKDRKSEEHYDTEQCLEAETSMWLAKYKDWGNLNLKTTFFQNSETQTLITHSNRTIFGNNYDHVVILNEHNHILQDPCSEVRIIFPLTFTTKENIEVHWTSFSDISALNKKLLSYETEKLASPVVEIFIKGHTKLTEYAIIEMPYKGTPEDLIVKTFESDEGVLPQSKTKVIPSKCKVNQELDTFYTFKDNKLLIYTKHFSGFYCVQQRHRRDNLQLTAFVFGALKRVNGQYAAAVSVYIGDELFSYKDYHPRMAFNEKTQKRQQLKEIQVNMPKENLEGDDYIEISVCILNGRELWEHRTHPTDQRQIYPEKQQVELENVARRCELCIKLESTGSEYPRNVEFSLVYKDTKTPDDVLQFTVELNICKKSGDVLQRNDIFIELELREQDKLPVKECDDRLYAMKYPEPEVGEGVDHSNQLRGASSVLRLPDVPPLGTATTTRAEESASQSSDVPSLRRSPATRGAAQASTSADVQHLERSSATRGAAQASTSADVPHLERSFATRGAAQASQLADVPHLRRDTAIALVSKSPKVLPSGTDTATRGTASNVQSDVQPQRRASVTRGTNSARQFVEENIVDNLVRGENPPRDYSVSIGPRIPPSPELSSPCQSTQLQALEPYKQDIRLTLSDLLTESCQPQV